MISKEYLRSQVIKGIQKMPYHVTIFKESLNKYNEPNGYEKVTDLTGVLYSDTKTGKNNIQYSDKGESQRKELKKFLVDYNDNSIKVKKGYYLLYKDKCYKIDTLGEEFEVLFDMQVIENEWIKV